MEGINFYSQEKAEKEANKVTKSLSDRYPNQNGVFTREQYESINKEIVERQVDLIKKLSSLSIPVYLIGGYASDILMGENNGVFNGEFSGPHTDIDALVENKNLQTIQDELTSIGLKFKISRVGDKIYKIFLDDKSGLEADIGVIEEDQGQFKIALKDREIKFNKDLVLGPEIDFFGQKVKVISPRLLVDSMSFYEKPRAKDVARAKALKEKFNLESNSDSSVTISD
jgi:hypothetical protein